MSARKIAHVAATGQYVHWCPGCRHRHAIAVDQPFANGARWTFDGNVGAPTFSPSVHIRAGDQTVCHYFLRNGQLEYLGDSAHALSGQTVPLPELPDWVRT